MKQQPDTTTNPPEQTRWQRWRMKPRDRRERVTFFVLCFVGAFVNIWVLNWAGSAGWPVWSTALTVLAVFCALYAPFHLWYRRRTPVMAAS